MSKNSFDRAMSQIASQAEAEIKAEERAQRRAIIMGRVRSVSVFLIGAALLTAGYLYRQELQNLVFPKTADAPKVASSTGSGGINDLQAAAAKRDKALDDISNSK